MTACIVGWAHTPFGKLENETVESLITQVTKDVLKNTAVAAKDIDAGYVGFFNANFSEQEFVSSLVLQADPDLRFKPITRVENACATGSAAVHQAIRHIESKQARLVLVVGVEKMTHLPSDEIGRLLLRASYMPEEASVENGFAGVFGRIASSYFQKYGDQSEALARIAAKNHKNGCDNPYAQIRKDLGYEFCRTLSDKNPMVAPPLKRTDCSLISDGAAALILADIETAMTMPKAVMFRAYQQVNDFLPVSKRDLTFFEGAQKAWNQAYNQARISVNDLSFAETHDCFTIAELMHYESMGLTKHGEGARATLEGWTEKSGKLPVNVSGGLKAKGHPIGATGVSMHAISAMQLTGEAGAMQLPSPTLAGIFNMGGSGVANYTSILERIH